ncbi:MAG: integrin alpha [Chloroflexota bacterium]
MNGQRVLRFVAKRLILFVVIALGLGLAPAATGTPAVAPDSLHSQGVSLPPGVPADWWAAVQKQIRQMPAPTGLTMGEAVPDWTAESDQTSAYLGVSVATAGDVNGDGYDDVIVGAVSYDNGQQDEGRALVYHGSAAGLSATANWTAESDQAYAYFGRSAAAAGDVNGDGYDDVIVGAYGYDNGQSLEGRAYVYYGSATGLSLTANWTAEGDQASAYFGYSVAAAGDVNGDSYDDVIVGAYEYTNGQTYEGRAYVYYGSATGLSLTANWTAESDQAYAYFGFSVATAGDVNGDGYDDVIVGADAYDNGQSDEGRAFVYHGSPTGLSLTANWTAESDQAGANFGRSVSTAGDVNGDSYDDVIVAAYYYDNGETDEGRAFVYHGAAAGLSLTANWTAESDQNYANFGRSVSTAEDVNTDGYGDVIVGAYWYDNDQIDEGRAYVYYGSTPGLSSSPNWTAESDQASAYFGRSVGTAGDVNGDGYADVIVGATYYDNGQSDEGGAFVYHGSDTGLRLFVDDNAYGITYDGWLGVADDQASGGGYRAASAAGQQLNHRTPLPDPFVPTWTAESNQSSGFADFCTCFGQSVATAGDVNGDGYDDVIVGAYHYDNGQVDEGRAFVYHGLATGLGLTANWTAGSDLSSAEFGYSVGTAGDVNGDGYDDVIVGAPYYRNGQGTVGRAYVYHGSASGLSASPNWTAESDQAFSYFSRSVATAGDINADGYDDIIVGAYSYSNGQSYEGRAYVYYGSAAGLNASPNWTAESDQASAYFGYSVATVGDVNGDGFADIIAGAYQYTNGQTWEGRAYVYHGSAAGLSLTADWTAESNRANAYFGISVGTAGDVNGDGYNDAIVGASDYSNGHSFEGRAFVYHGSVTGLSLTANWTAESNQEWAFFGTSVSAAGDVNSDGHDDVIVGACGSSQAFVFHGSPGGLSTTPNWTAEGDNYLTGFGISVGMAGDINGDAYADVIVGEPSYTNGQTNEGRALAYDGGPGGLGSIISLHLLMYRGPDQGLAQVLLDGVNQGTIDLYAPAPEYQYQVTYPGLLARRHTVTLRALGQKNPASSGTEVRLDAIEVPGVIIEDNSLQVRYHNWSGRTANAALGDGLRYAAATGSTVSFDFTGPQFTWISLRGPAMGQAEVRVDGILVVTVDLYRPTLQWQYEVAIGGLTSATHTAEIYVLGTHNPSSTGNTVVFDGYHVP